MIEWMVECENKHALAWHTTRVHTYWTRTRGKHMRHVRTFSVHKTLRKIGTSILCAQNLSILQRMLNDNYNCSLVTYSNIFTSQSCFQQHK